MKDAIGISFMATVVDLIGGFAFLFDMQHSIEKQDKQGLNTEFVWRLMYVLKGCMLMNGLTWLMTTAAYLTEL